MNNNLKMGLDLNASKNDSLQVNAGGPLSLSRYQSMLKPARTPKVRMSATFNTPIVGRSRIARPYFHAHQPPRVSLVLLAKSSSTLEVEEV